MSKYPRKGGNPIEWKDRRPGKKDQSSRNGGKKKAGLPHHTILNGLLPGSCRRDWLSVKRSLFARYFLGIRRLRLGAAAKQRFELHCHRHTCLYSRCCCHHPLYQNQRKEQHPNERKGAHFMKQKLFTLLLTMALLITALPTAVSAAYYPSAKSINENSIYDTLQNYSKENKNPLWLFSVYLTT